MLMSAEFYMHTILRANHACTGAGMVSLSKEISTSQKQPYKGNKAISLKWDKGYKN